MRDSNVREHNTPCPELCPDTRWLARTAVAVQIRGVFQMWGEVDHVEHKAARISVEEVG
jgi:hypothetical protein